TLNYLLGCLWRQLAYRRGLFSKRILASYSKHAKRHSRPTTSESITSLQQELEDLLLVYIVVDALDECEKDVMNSLVPSLRFISPNCHLLFTSRPLPRIDNLLK